MEKSLMIFICALSFFITSKYCCVLSGSGGSCLTSGLSFGGRLYFPYGTPDYLQCNGEINGPKIIILQRPRSYGKGKHIRSMFGRFGVGRIWMSDKSTCRQPTGDGNLQCPCLDKSTPCHLDLKCNPRNVCSLPYVDCNITTTPPSPIPTGYKVEYRKIGDDFFITEEFDGIEPRQPAGSIEEGYIYEYWISYRYGTIYGEREIYGTFLVPCRDVNLTLQLSTLSERTGMASVVATWTLRELTGPCFGASKTITAKQMDWNNCDALRDPVPDVHLLDDNDRSYRLRKKHPNTEYNVSVTVATAHQEFTVWQVIRTQETVPTSHPVNLTVHSYKRSRQLDVRWNKPPCRTRNGRIKYYSIKMEREGVTRVHIVKGTRARYVGFSIGEEFTVQVAAINSHGMGPYCPKFVGTFV